MMSSGEYDGINLTKLSNDQVREKIKTAQKQLHGKELTLALGSLRAEMKRRGLKR